jgi:tetratricopeptide (TPR) repeat protein
MKVAFSFAVVAGAASWIATGCSGWDPREPFTHDAPEVDQAVKDLDAGQVEPAQEALQRYLGTGACVDGGIGLPDAVRQKPSGSFDLGLVLFQLAERYGERFGDEELADASSPDEQAKAAQRSAEIDCALVVVKAIAADPKVPAELRARAYYLAGNLEFLRKRYEDAVKLYDQALAIVPGIAEDAGKDGIGRDAAWNRSIALRRIDDQKDAGQDASDDAATDGGDGGPDASDAGPDADDGGQDAAPDSGDDGGNDGGKDGGEDGGDPDEPDGGEDAGQDAGDGGAPSQPEPPPSAEPEPARQQDDRILDQLEQAPTYQEQEAKQRAGARRGRGMEDK